MWKISPPKNRVVLLITLLVLLNACTSTLQQTIPTATTIRTIPPTITMTPALKPQILGEYKLLSPEDMRYDLNELFHQIEMIHPNPYAKRSKAEVDLDRQRIYEELD